MPSTEVPSTNTTSVVAIPVAPELDFDTLPTIVVFGTTGHGKSSVINMLKCHPAHAKTAYTSLSAVGVTTSLESYEPYVKDIKGSYARLFDCPGVGEPPTGTVPTDIAVRTFYQVLITQRKINLIIHVIRSGRQTGMEEANFALIRLLAGPDIPMAVVFSFADQTCLPGEDLSTWWNQQTDELKARLPTPFYISITSSRGRSTDTVRHMQYAESQIRLQDLIERSMAPEGFPIEPQTPELETFFTKLQALVHGQTWSETRFQRELRELLTSYSMGDREAAEAARALVKQKPGDIVALPAQNKPLPSPANPRPSAFNPSLAARRGKHPTELPTVVLIGVGRTRQNYIIKMLRDAPGPQDSVKDWKSLEPTFHRKLMGSGDQVYRVITTPVMLLAGRAEPSPSSTIPAVYRLLVSLPRVDFVIFARRIDRIDSKDDLNYRLLQMICKGLVPTGIAITDMETHTSSDRDAYKKWWENESGASEQYKFTASVCLVTDVTDSRYEESRASLEKMILETASPDGYSFSNKMWTPFKPSWRSRFLNRAPKVFDHRGLSPQEIEFYELLRLYKINPDACLEMVKTMELAAEVLEGR